MKINGKNPLFSPKPIGFYDSSIGRLAIYAISHGHHTKLVESLGGTLSTCNPRDFFKRIVPYVCWPAEKLDGDQTKPNAVAVMPDDVDKLTDADLDGIAGRYVESQDYLYRKHVTETKKDAEGRSVLSTDYGKVEHPRQEGESNIHYLHRLMVLEEDRRREQMKTLTKTLLGPTHFSQALSQSITKTLTMGDTLSRL
ncbi:hypothetical protein, partial [Anaerobaca lacustris]|nr:hypothetical protein [Sedimentisphaerales bacterium M17dextr]